MPSNDHDPIDPLETYDMRETALLVFHRSRPWLYRNLPRLTAKHDFPKPVHPIGLRRWNGQRLIDWMQRVDAQDPKVFNEKPRDLLGERLAQLKPLRSTKEKDD